MLDAADLAAICTGPHRTIGEALEQLDRTHKRILLVVTEERHLLGVVADPDFRRAMLARIDFQRPISDIMTREPVIARSGMSEDEMLRLIEQFHVHGLPLLDRDGVVVGLVQVENLLARRSTPLARTAVVMAGGLGERLRPLTEHMPKPLIAVGDKPILFTILDKLLAARFDRIYLAVNYKADAIEEAIVGVARYREVVRFLHEDKRLGTAGALSLLPETPGEPFVITNGDLLTNVDFGELLRFHRREGNAVTVGLREEHFTLPYGIAQLEGTRITGIQEKPSVTHFINAGLYVIDPSVLRYIRPETYLDATELVNGLIESGERVGGFLVREYWIDIGQPHQLEQARRDYSKMFGSKPMQDHPTG